MSSTALRDLTPALESQAIGGGGAPYDHRSSDSTGCDGVVEEWEMSDICILLCSRQHLPTSRHIQ